MATVVLAALAGGLGAVAVRDGMLATPTVARWLRESLEPLFRAGSEGYDPSRDERRRLALLGAGAVLGATLLVIGPGPATALVIAGPAVASWTVARRRARYRARVERSLPSVATALADALAAGQSVRGALAAASASLEGPPMVELARLRADLEMGASTADALATFQRRMRSTRVDSFVAALASQQVGGGDLAALLRRHAAAGAERDRVVADARAATAQARFTGLLVVAMPSGAALFAELVSPGFFAALLAEPASTVLLAAAAALQLAGFAAIKRLSSVAR